MSQAKPSIVYLGTPQFAVPILEALITSNTYNVLGVITQPDRPAGRGLKLQHPPVKDCAIKYNIPVFQPASLKGIELRHDNDSSSSKLGNPQLHGTKSNNLLIEWLNSLADLDAFVTAAYGKIIPTSLLDFSPHGIINVHPSLLPRWRGAAPIQYALFSGDPITGVSIMHVDQGLDTGAVYTMKECQILDTDDCGKLHERLAEMSAELICETLPKILNGTLRATPQLELGATYAEKWDKDDFNIKWEEPAEVSLRRIRTCSPFPGARTTFSDMPIKIFSAHLIQNQQMSVQYQAGMVVEVNKRELIVAAGINQFICIDELQLPGKKRLNTPEVLRGMKVSPGMLFT